MMKGIKYACFSVLSLALLSACSMDQTSESSMGNQPTMNTTTNKNPLVGKDASDFELKDMKGNTVKLSDYKGKKVYLKFWATWCGPCRKAIPELNEIAKEFSKDVVVIGISDEPVEKIKAMKEPVIEYYYGVDTKKTMDKILEIKGIPHVIIIDPKGIVRWEGFPLLENHKLTPEVVKNLIEKYK